MKNEYLYCLSFKSETKQAKIKLERAYGSNFVRIWSTDLILCFDRLRNHKAYDMCNPSGLASRSVTITN